MNNSFSKYVLSIVEMIPRGKISTYADIARIVGKPKAYRAVANAIGKNPQLIKIPCHRVIRSNGEVGGYAQGTKKKIELLRKEGIKVVKGRVVGLAEKLYRFDSC
jgi:methylated-DNA-[protein]-cysteine S-methyltransferase